jgi:hypothetical protein
VGAQCRFTAPVRVGRPRVLPVGVFAWRGELGPFVAPWETTSIGEAPHSCGTPGPVLQPPCVGPTLVGSEAKTTCVNG